MSSCRNLGDALLKMCSSGETTPRQQQRHLHHHQQQLARTERDLAPRFGARTRIRKAITKAPHPDKSFATWSIYV